jgi:hypothetical protein
MLFGLSVSIFCLLQRLFGLSLPLSWQRERHFCVSQPTFRAARLSTLNSQPSTTPHPMTKTQISKVTSYQTLKLVLDDADNQPIWNALPAFANGVNQLYGSINVLATLGQAQTADTTGIAGDKARLATSVINRAVIIAGAAGTFASATDNQTLAAKFNITPSKLQNLRDAQLDDAAQAIHDDADALVAKDAATMANYGLTAAKLTDLQSAITAYSAMVGSPRAAIAGKTAITAAIEAEIARADKLLNEQLDRLVLQFEADQPAFVSA